MKSPSRRRLLHTTACLAAASWSAGATAQQGNNTESPLAKVLRERVAAEGVGLSLALVDGAEVQFLSAGLSSAVQGQPVDADTLYEYGSITKTFTGLLLADMVLRKELALTDPVEAVLPKGVKLRDSQGAAIQWIDLATHRSGLPRLPANMNPTSTDDPYNGYNLDDLWSFGSSWKPERARDAKWEYSNLGYGLLAEALALRATRSYEALLRERVLGPLGLMDMSLALRGKTIPGLTRGHNGQRQSVANWRFEAMAGAGALVGSAKALARYAQAALGVFDHPLKDAFALATKRHADGPALINPMALGWLIAPLDGRQLVTHDGGTGGFSSSVVIDPMRRRAALVLANAQVVVNDLSIHALEPRMPLRNVASERRDMQREGQVLAAEQMAPLPGTYAFNPQFKIVIRLQGGKLLAQATGQGEFELFALDARKFFAKITALELHFEGADGPPPAFVLHQAGQKLRFVRE